MPSDAPLLIALCGHPGSGKSTVQEILKSRYAVAVVDDGRVLRDIAKMLFGLSESDVSTQAGKKRITRLDDSTADKSEWENRDILGTLGVLIESKFGELAVPRAAIRAAGVQHFHASAVSFGSVRKRQGLAYKEAGGLVIEVVSPLADPSLYQFDWYDKTIVDLRIFNNGTDMQALAREVERVVGPFLVGAPDVYSKDRIDVV